MSFNTFLIINRGFRYNFYGVIHNIFQNILQPKKFYRRILSFQRPRFYIGR